MDKGSKRFLWLYAKVQLKLKYRNMYLGFLWQYLEPACYLLVLSVVFSVVNRMNINDYAVFLFSALIPWRYFDNTVFRTTESIVNGSWLLKKIYISPLVFPLTQWIVASIEFLHSFIVLLLILIFIKKTWTIHMIVLPLAIIPWSILGIGMGIICSIIFVFFRDFRPMVQMFINFSFFSSPILIKIEMFKDHTLQAFFLKLHPITYFAALFQKPIYYESWPSYTDWVVTLSLSSLLLILGNYLMQKFKGRYYFYL